MLVQNNIDPIHYSVVFINVLSVTLEMKLRKRGREGGREEE